MYTIAIGEAHTHILKIILIIHAPDVNDKQNMKRRREKFLNCTIYIL